MNDIIRNKVDEGSIIKYAASPNREVVTFIELVSEISFILEQRGLRIKEILISSKRNEKQ